MKMLSTLTLRVIITGACLVSIALPTAHADVVIDWNVAMTHFSEIQPPPGVPPYLEARTYAMVHLALRNAIADATNGQGKNQGGYADANVAGAQAAHDVLVSQFPGGAIAFDTLLTAQLAAIPDGPAKTKSQQIGSSAAAAMLAARANDGSATAEVPFAPGSNPGDFQFSPPFNGPPFNGYAAAPLWGSVIPFALKRGDQFRAPPPYKVTDMDYTFDLNEIKACGSLTSSVRSEDQTALALFWYESSTFGWNRIARTVAEPHSLSLMENAQLFASLNVAIADAYIASLDSKYTYNFWRPVTAIQAAATDGNPSTEADPTWQPLLLTPPIPDYPSGHSCAGGAASTVLIATFGDEQTFTLPSTMSLPFPSILPRTFHRISDAAKENAHSRMLVGIHFRLACEVGLEQGQEVGAWVVKHAP